MVRTIVYCQTSENRAKLEYEVGLAMAYISFCNLEFYGLYLDDQWAEIEDALKGADMLLIPTELFDKRTLDDLAWDCRIVIDTLDGSYTSDPEKLEIKTDSLKKYLAEKRRAKNIGLASRVNAAEKGYYNRIPYGYEKHENGLKAVAETALVVKEVFSWALDGMTNQEIAAKLNSLEIEAPDNRNNWNPDGVRYILSNEAYTGRLLIGRTSSMPFAMKDRIERIIDDETFDNVKKILEGRKRPVPAENDEVNLYGAMARCKACGSKLSFIKKDLKQRKLESIFRCVKHTGSKPAGIMLEKMPSIKAADMNQNVMEICNEYICQATAIVRGNELVMELYDWEQEDLFVKLCQIGRARLEGKEILSDGLYRAMIDIESERMEVEMQVTTLTAYLGSDPYRLYQDEFDIEKVKPILDKIYLTPEGEIEVDYKVNIDLINHINHIDRES